MNQTPFNMSWVHGSALVLLLLALLWAALYLLGATQWTKETRSLLAQLDATRTEAAVDVYDPSELEGLPAPVQRYFQTVLTAGQPIVSGLTVKHSGSFNMGQDADSWKPFTSTQEISTHRPGFVWAGDIAILPGVPVHVHDAYVAGRGVLRPTVFGLFRLADLHDGGELASEELASDELARGELMRYLAEATWYPTALLPSQGVRWDAIDGATARATLRDGAVQASLDFHFSPDGLIERVHSDARGALKDGKFIATPWEGRWSNWQLQHGMRVPMSGEVAWLHPQGRKAYWRGTITLLEYRNAQ